MFPEPEKKPKRPWSGLGFVIICVIAILVGYFIVLPVGLEIRHVFETLTNAFGNH